MHNLALDKCQIESFLLAFANIHRINFLTCKALRRVPINYFLQ